MHHLFIEHLPLLLPLPLLLLLLLLAPPRHLERTDGPFQSLRRFSIDMVPLADVNRVRI